MTHLAIIIVSYNTCDLLRNCLHSVFKAAESSDQHLNVSVMVVDNASTDESAAMVEAEFPQVSLIASAQNLGFTKANNLALHRLGFGAQSSAEFAPEFVLLLNPDTEVSETALWQMVSTLQGSAQAGVCGARLSYGDGTFQHGAFHFPGWTQVALDLFPLHSIPGLHRLYSGAVNGRYAEQLWNGEDPFTVDFVLGAALMVKTEAIRQVGLLDEAFFMYCEEMDWCLRIHHAGWQILAVPIAHVTHYEGQSSRQVRWASFTRLWKSRLRFYAKHARHYSLLERFAIHKLVQLNLLWRKRAALRRFGLGKVDGSQLGEEIAAYDEILLLL